jgi:hypothetical protein
LKFAGLHEDAAVIETQQPVFRIGLYARGEYADGIIHAL